MLRAIGFTVVWILRRRSCQVHTCIVTTYIIILYSRARDDNFVGHRLPPPRVTQYNIMSAGARIYTNVFGVYFIIYARARTTIRMFNIIYR